MTWLPASVEDVERIVTNDLRKCSVEQIAKFRRRRAVPPYLAPIVRYGKREEVVMVTRKQSQVIYWEDVEEGFNISPIAADGTVLEHYCNQDSLGVALNRWIRHGS